MARQWWHDWFSMLEGKWVAKPLDGDYVLQEQSGYQMLCRGGQVLYVRRK